MTIEMPGSIEMGAHDLILYNAMFGVALGSSLDKRGLLDRDDLADDLEGWATRGAQGEPWADLLRVVASGLRRGAPPHLHSITGGKDG